MTFWKKNHGMAVPASLRYDSWVGQCFGRRSPPKFLVCAAKNQFFFFSSSLFLSPDSHQKVVDDTWCTRRSFISPERLGTHDRWKPVRSNPIWVGQGLPGMSNPTFFFRFFLAVESFFPLSFDLPREHFLVNSLLFSDSWMVYDGKSSKNGWELGLLPLRKPRCLQVPLVPALQRDVVFTMSPGAVPEFAPASAFRSWAV